MASLLSLEHVRIGDRCGWLGDPECLAAPITAVDLNREPGFMWIDRENAASMRVGRAERVVVY